MDRHDPRRLRLGRETLRQLRHEDLTEAAGGTLPTLLCAGPSASALLYECTCPYTGQQCSAQGTCN